VSVDRGAYGPQRQGLGGATGRGAQVTALGYAGEQLKPAAGPHREVEPFPQVRRSVAGPARPQVQLHDPGQQARLVPQVARVPGPGQARRADTRGFGQVPGIGQHAGQHIAAPPGEPAGDPGRDLPGLAGQPHRLVVIAGVIGFEAELGQGQQLPGRVPDLLGQGQRAAGVAGRLGGPAPSAAMPSPGRPGRRSAPGTAAGPRRRRGPR
jgi:hypothetical protein